MAPTLQQAQALAGLPLGFLRQEYPSHIMHVLNQAQDAATPRQLHPVFYGCYDWHSAVHGFWLLLRCQRHWPELLAKNDITALFDQHFRPELMQREVDYFRAPNRAAFERPYGYAWILALAQELSVATQPQAGVWQAALRPLTQELRQRLLAYLATLSYPIRAGNHGNTAFALTLAFDYACSQQDGELDAAIVAAAQRYYSCDSNYPAHYEPAGDDFLSGALTQAMLMSRVLAKNVFVPWFDRFLPQIGNIGPLMQPAHLSDRNDPKISHLDGLNLSLSRAWCLKQILPCLPPDHPQRPAMQAAIGRHFDAAINHVVDSHYHGGHWLASFAMLALED